MEPLIKILTLQNSSAAQHDTASWGLNIDTITTQEEYLTAATNKKSRHSYFVCHLLYDVSEYSQCLQEVRFSCSLELGGVYVEEDSDYMCHSDTGKALSSSSLICSD